MQSGPRKDHEDHDRWPLKTIGTYRTTYRHAGIEPPHKLARFLKNKHNHFARFKNFFCTMIIFFFFVYKEKINCFEL